MNYSCLLLDCSGPESKVDMGVISETRVRGVLNITQRGQGQRVQNRTKDRSLWNTTLKVFHIRLTPSIITNCLTYLTDYQTTSKFFSLVLVQYAVDSLEKFCNLTFNCLIWMFLLIFTGRTVWLRKHFLLTVSWAFKPISKSRAFKR